MLEPDQDATNAKTWNVGPDTYRHLIAHGSRLTVECLFEFAIWKSDGFLRERLDLKFGSLSEYLEWVEAHCPSAKWLYQGDKISLIIFDPREAVEYKLRWAERF